jgi:hypothetical protein
MPAECVSELPPCVPVCLAACLPACLLCHTTACTHRYGVTHSGLDAMVVRYMDEMDTFVNLGDNLAFPNHTR